jgi:putative transposase
LPKGNVTLHAVYPTDLTNSQWSLIEPFFKPKKLGRKPEYEKRYILNAIFYVLKGGIPWNMLPHDFPPYKVVNDYFNQWKASGLFLMVNRVLVGKQRCKSGRKKDPSIAITDSQSVRGTSFTRNDVGIDGHKKVKGRKRHLVTDVDGHILSCHVTPANTHDSKACERTIEKFIEQFGKPRLKKILADSAYRGELEDLIPLRFDAQLEIASFDKNKNFDIKPKRWVIERTIAWLNNCRRLVRDCERSTAASEAWVYLANIRLTLIRLSPA